MAQLFKNNAATTLSGDINDSVTSIGVSDGAVFGTVASPNFMLATLASGSPESAWEIVKITNIATNTLTVLRAQEGTSAASWSAGASITGRFTAGSAYGKADLETALTGKQAADADLDAIAALSTTGLIERTGAGTAGTVTITTPGKNILDDATVADQRTTLGLGGAAVLAVGTTAGTVAAGDHTHTAYQAADADLDAIAALSTTGLIERTGAGTAAIVTITTPGKNLLDDATVGDQRTTLGLGGAAVLSVGTTNGTVAAGDDSRITGAAPLASPTFTGTVTIPTGASITTPTITKPVMNATNPTAATYTPSAAGTATLDLGVANQHEITMPAGNITIALSNATNSQVFLVTITQDGVGSRTVTWFSTIRWAGGSAPTLTTTASKRDVLGFRRTGTNTYDGFVVGQNI